MHQMFFSGRSRIFLLFLGLPVLAAQTAPGIGNFDQVDEHVYRGAQPTEQGFAYLAKLGVKTILDLREDDARTTGERRMVIASGMQYVNVPMTGLTPPTAEEITKILALLEDPTNGPVFVHCKRGADRTGAVIGAYRIDHDHWDNTRALKEAMQHGMSFYQIPRQKYIRTFQPRTQAKVRVVPFESDLAQAFLPAVVRLATTAKLT
jgi:protein tyrosine/serine phosphatase